MKVTLQTQVRKIAASADGGRVEGLACADPGARTPIGASGNFILFVNLKLKEDVFKLNELVSLIFGKIQV